MVAVTPVSIFDVVIDGNLRDELLPPKDPLIANLRSLNRSEYSQNDLVEERNKVIDQLIEQNSKLALFVNEFKNATALEEPDFEGFDLRSREDRKTILETIVEMESGSSNLSDEFKFVFGVGGFQTVLFLKSLLVLENICVISGKIIDYIFYDESAGGFTSSNKHGPGKHIGVGSGHLSVEMVVETFEGDARFFAGNPNERKLTHWDIDVIRNVNEGLEGYKVIARTGDASSPNDDPFPGTVEFPEANTNPANRFSVWCRGLDHKLYAEGQSISVRHIYEQIDCGPLFLVSGDDVRYRSNEDSCIDLMFKGYPPAHELPEQDSYCLGRCAKPQIINSDGV